MKKKKKKLFTARPPMNWCYALVKTGNKDNPYYIVREICHVQGQIVSYCDSPMTLGAEDPKDVIKLLRRIIRDIKNSPFVS